MGRTFTIVLIIFLAGLFLLPLRFFGENHFERLYEKLVEINYRSIKDGRDILSMEMSVLLLDMPNPFPGEILGFPLLPLTRESSPGLREEFLKSPYILEVAEEISQYLFIPFNPEEINYQDDDSWAELWGYAVTPDLARVANLEILEGRFLSWEDEDKRSAVCVIAYSGEKDYFQKALKREVKLGDFIYLGPHNIYEIVGLVKVNAIYDDTTKKDNRMVVFLPLSTNLKRKYVDFRKANVAADFRPRYHFRVLDVFKAARDLEKITERLVGKHSSPRQRISPLGDYPPIGSRENYKYRNRVAPWRHAEVTADHPPDTDIIIHNYNSHLSSFC